MLESDRVVDVQRAGPATGSPTKTEQGDLLAALWGRHSQSPLPILAPSTPGDCFHTALEAFRLAVKYMTPVVILSDGYLANSAEPWRIPEVDSLPLADVDYASAESASDFHPYDRDPETLARPLAIPGTPGLEHRIGGLTKAPVSGNVVHDEEIIARRFEVEQVTAATDGRLDRVVAAFRIWGESPFWGVGWSMFRQYSEQYIGASGNSAHNGYLRWPRLNSSGSFR